MKEYESNIRHLEQQLMELERRLTTERRRTNNHQRTPLSRCTSNNPQTPEYVSNEDNEQLRRLRRQLSAEKRVMVALQRLKAGDFYRPRQGQILERMMTHINRYPPSLQQLFSVRDCVGEVMGYQPTPSPTVKRAVAFSSQQHKNRVVRSDVKRHSGAVRHKDEEDSKCATFTPPIKFYQPVVPASEPRGRKTRIKPICQKAARSSHIHRGRNRAGSHSLLRKITESNHHNFIRQTSSEKFHTSSHRRRHRDDTVCKNLEFNSQ
jgi:hypothetical protein